MGEKRRHGRRPYTGAKEVAQGGEEGPRPRKNGKGARYLKRRKDMIWELKEFEFELKWGDFCDDGGKLAGDIAGWRRMKP